MIKNQHKPDDLKSKTFFNFFIIFKVFTPEIITLLKSIFEFIETIFLGL